MRVAVLGPVAVDDDKGSLRTLRAPRPRLVLARLTLDAGREVTTGELHDDVWMGTGSRTVVKTTVSRLRDHLADPSVINSAGGRYALDMDRVDLDVHRFDALVEDADEAIERGDTATAISRLGAALDLWRGPAYADCDTRFAEVERARLERRRTEVKECRLQLRARGGETAAIDDLVSLVVARPDRGRLVMAAMETLHAAGRTREAIAVARAHATAAADGWGLYPMPEVVALERRLLTNDPLLVATSAGRRPVGREESASPLRFVGRELEMDRLLRQMTGPREQARLTLVSGAPGMGKSALLRAAAARVESLDVATVFVGCAQSPDHALDPVVRLIEAIVERLDDHEISRIDARGDIGFRHLVPILDSRLSPREGSEIPIGREEMVEAMVRFVAHALPDSVVIVDDLQWADGISIDVLSRIHSYPSGPRLVGAVHSAALSSVVAACEAHGGADVVSVGGLDQREIRHLLREIPGSGPDLDDLPRMLADATGGSPLFILSLLQPASGVEELARQLLEGPLPESTIEAVDYRLSSLGDDVVALLEVAAVVGNPFSIAVVLKLSDRTSELLDRAVAAGVVRLTGPDIGRFGHDLLGEALYQRIPAGRKVELHDQMADLLLTTGASAMKLAHHAIEAAELDPRRAIDALRATASELTDAFDYRKAATRLDEALVILDRVGSTGTRLETEVLLQRGAVAVAAGEPEHVELLIRAASQAVDDDLFVDAVTHLCDFTAASNGLTADERVTRLLDDALTRPTERRQACRLSIAAAVFFSLSQQHQRARELYADAWDCANDLGDDSLLDTYLYNAGVVLSGPDDLKDRRRAAELLKTRRSRSLRLGFASAYLSWSTAMIEGDGEEVDRAFATRPTLGPLAGDPGVVFGALFADAAVAHLRGHLDEAEHHLMKAIAGGADWASPGPIMASFGAILFAIRDAQGRLSEVAPSFRDSLDRTPDHPVLRAHVALGSLADDDPAPAVRTLADLCSNNFVDVPRDVTWTAAMVLFARCAHATGAKDAAAQIHELLLPHAGRMSTIGVATYGPIDLALARTALTIDDNESARHHLEAAMDITARLRAPLMRAEALALLTEVGSGTVRG